ncbi:hypothetical protein Pcinc_022353 [Petrolisthes cinctipes]|uniref:Structural maintenance of chromosomes protein 5 n=2 Tax=Petrolisthes cinctipes TaxID=88211 RepID=A0AAE1FFM5_PETCI|nr:hypothetical protein Pcinc_022353 [Petrolisthes cinctipes]
MKVAAEKNTNLTQQLEMWRNEKRVLVARKDERKVLEQRIRQKEGQLERCKNGFIDLKAEEVKTNASIQEEVLNLVRVSEKRAKAVLDWDDYLTKYIKTNVKERIAVADIQRSQQSLSASVKELNNLKAQVKEIGDELDNLKVDAQTALQKLLKDLNISSYKHISSEVRDQFQSSNLEETEKKLAEVEAHRDCLVTASEKEVEEYKRREAEMRLLRRRLDTLQADTAAHATDMESVKQCWVPRISSLVDDISTKFSKFMAGAGYAGEVTLSVPEDPNTFSNYGISIKVSFRDHQCLKELTAQHQSGGERAMATALYLVTLQSLTPVSFRCVDEINQGMDPINERQLLKMLMDTESNENASQCFFVTPKLLPDMEYTKTVNTMVVYNSQTMLPHSRFNLERIFRAQRKVMQKHS